MVDETPVDSVTLIWAWLREGWRYRARHNERMREHKAEYDERIRYEMSVILGKNFQDYFLVVSDLVRFAKDSGIAVGPGRGSAAGSLICYLLRITEIDPLRFQHMMFERFLDPSRDDMPDIDLDFDDERRHEVQEYAEAKYGTDCVGNVANFVRYRGKTAINGVSRAHKIPKWAADTVNDLIIDRTAGDPRQHDSVRDTFSLFPAAAKILERYPALAHAMDLEGDYSGMGMHAAGLVILSQPITDICALYEREVGAGAKKRRVSVVSADKKVTGYLGMLKVDLLGLLTMGMITRALEIIGMSLEDLYRIPLDDPKTLQAFRDLDLTGIFQFEGRTQRGVTREVLPDNFDHLIDISGLARPGPLFSGAERMYVARKHGRAPIVPIHPIVDELTKHTYGTMVFQEQVFQTIAQMGGFPGNKIGDIRRIISLKLGENSFNEMFEEFAQGAHDLHGVDRALAQSVWDTMVTSSKYLFNYAHCCCYSMIAVWCQWLKQHHPEAFYAGQLSKAKKEKLPRLLQDVLRHEIDILPPHPELSGITWEPNSGGLRAGFLQVPGIGDVTSRSLVAHRDSTMASVGSFEWKNFQAVKGVGKVTIANMNNFAAMEDPFGLQRVHSVLSEYRAGFQRDDSDFRGLPRPTHTSDTMPEHGDHYVVWMGFVKGIKVKNEIEKVRQRSEDPNITDEEILDDMKDPHLLYSAVLTCYDDGEEDVYIRVHRWNYPMLKDYIESIAKDEDIIIASGKKREGGTFGVSIFADGLEVLEQDYGDDQEESDALVD